MCDCTTTITVYIYTCTVCPLVHSTPHSKGDYTAVAQYITLILI